MTIEAVLNDVISLAGNYFKEVDLENFKDDVKIWNLDIIGSFYQLSQSGNSLSLELSLLSDTHVLDVTYRDCGQGSEISKSTVLLDRSSIASYHLYRHKDYLEFHLHASSGYCMFKYSANIDKYQKSLIEYIKLFSVK